MKKINNIIRRHLGPVLAGTAACVVLVGGILILTLVGTGGTSHAAGSGSTPTTAAPPSAKAKHHAVRATVTAISGDTWTVTVKGSTLTVNVTPQTKFGTKAAPLAPTDFAVGGQIAIAGSRTGTTITATRIARVPTPAPTPTPTTIPSPPPPG